ncbi:hypothetical protein Acr_04g0002330 [Actinidia rufa]|uniref:Uncharacterized protein n=1 Tax=Actinidia rufa TaxID=165716 RepID=A0A7J0EGA1_9ERIC|nr:hypothetical protein Acr_04g0002330 [Actinidia rufa]
MPSQRIEEDFYPIAYKLLTKAGYNPQESTALRKLSSEAIGENVHGLNSAQNILKQKGYTVQNSHTGLGYNPPTDVHIMIKKSSNHYITTEENTSSIPTKPSVFDRLGKPKSRTLAFDRLRPSSMIPTSPIPQSLKMRLKIVVVTKTIPKASNVPTSKESVAFSYHITSLDGEDHPEKDAKDAPLAFKEGVKSTIDDLKEINLGTLDNPRLIYITALLISEEQKMYIELLFEYKDVFEEMPGIDSKVAIHNLAVKRGVRPIKQAQQRF